MKTKKEIPLEKILKIHEKGKLSIKSKIHPANYKTLSKVYTPGVAQVCSAIASDPSLAKKYTIINNTIAVITDGSAVLGLGDIGPLAGMPEIEGKCMLFKEFGGVDAFPILLNTRDVDQIVQTIINIAPSFGGINLEDISAPRCFEIERRLKEKLNIPVFNDDQHGTAVVVLAGLINSLKLVKKDISKVKIVINGAGAAGIAIAKLLITYGAKNIILFDSKGAIYAGRRDLNPQKEEIAKVTNLEKLAGNVNQLISGRDVFIGVSTKECLTVDSVKKMNKDSIVFAMAIPEPEIRPELITGIAKVIATGRSDYPNQINNVLCSPGLFRGALDAGATKITEEMYIAAATAIAGIMKPSDLRPESIIPSVFNKQVAKKVATAVIKTWK